MTAGVEWEIAMQNSTRSYGQRRGLSRNGSFAHRFIAQKTGVFQINPRVS